MSGIVDAGLLPDDNPKHVLWQKFYPPQRSPETGVLVSLYEVES